VFLFALICLFSAVAIVLRLRSVERHAPTEPEVDEAVAVATSAAPRPSAVRPRTSASPAISSSDRWSDDAPPRPRSRVPAWLGPLARGSVAVVLLVWLVAPIVWIVIASVQTEQAMTQTPPQVSLNLDFGWYAYLLGHPKWIGSLAVSVMVALATTVITILVGALTAFPLARLQIPFRNVFMGILVFTQMIPAIVMAIPVLLLFQALHLRDSVLGLVIINVAFLLPLVIWLERGYFEDVPRSIESAARIDGCSRLGTLFRITMPAAAPGIFAIAIVLLIGTWNEFLFAVVLGDKNAVTVTRRITELGVLNPQFGVAYTQLAAAGVLAVLPPLILVLLFHRRIVRGLTEGFVKG
jgi:multiple sugar transport system permease protein